MSLTSDRYAKALFDLTQQQNALEDVQASLTQIKKIMDTSADFRSFLNNPLLSYEERSKVLKALFEGKVPELLYRFLVFVTYKGRLDILEEIIGSFDHLYLSATGQMRAYVKTALPIDDAEKGAIERHLQEKFKQKVIVRWQVDPSLIGGFRIFADGKLYDYSFKDQLDNFLQQSMQPV